MFDVFDLTSEEKLVIAKLLDEAYASKTNQLNSERQKAYGSGIIYAIKMILSSKKIFISEDTVEQIIDEYFDHKTLLWQERGN